MLGGDLVLLRRGEGVLYEEVETLAGLLDLLVDGLTAHSTLARYRCLTAFGDCLEEGKVILGVFDRG